MGKLKEIQLNDVFDKLAEGKRCFLIQEIDEKTPIGQLRKAGGFVYLSDDPENIREKLKEESRKAEEEVAEREEAPASKSRKPKSIVDHDKILALAKAGWAVKAIAEEVDASEQTVRNHLKWEGL